MLQKQWQAARILRDSIDLIFELAHKKVGTQAADTHAAHDDTLNHDLSNKFQNLAVTNDYPHDIRAARGREATTENERASLRQSSSASEVCRPAFEQRQKLQEGSMDNSMSVKSFDAAKSTEIPALELPEEATAKSQDGQKGAEQEVAASGDALRE